MRITLTLEQTEDGSEITGPLTVSIITRKYTADAVAGDLVAVCKAAMLLATWHPNSIRDAFEGAPEWTDDD